MTKCVDHFKLLLHNMRVENEYPNKFVLITRQACFEVMPLIRYKPNTVKTRKAEAGSRSGGRG